MPRQIIEGKEKKMIIRRTKVRGWHRVRGQIGRANYGRRKAVESAVANDARSQR